MSISLDCRFCCTSELATADEARTATALCYGNLVTVARCLALHGKVIQCAYAGSLQYWLGQFLIGIARLSKASAEVRVHSQSGAVVSIVIESAGGCEPVPQGACWQPSLLHGDDKTSRVPVPGDYSDEPN